MDFCHLLKTQGKISNKYSQKPLDSVKKSTKDALKLFRKEQFKKQGFQKNHHKMMKITMKDIYLQKKGNKLLMN